MVHLYWESWVEGVDPMVFSAEVVEALRAAGLSATAPVNPSQAVAVDLGPPKP